MDKEVEFKDLDLNIQEKLKLLVAHYHYRNAKKHEDGSLGEVKISPGQLRHLLVQAYLEGYHDH